MRRPFLFSGDPQCQRGHSEFLCIASALEATYHDLQYGCSAVCVIGSQIGRTDAQLPGGCRSCRKLVAMMDRPQNLSNQAKDGVAKGWENGDSFGDHRSALAQNLTCWVRPTALHTAQVDQNVLGRAARFSGGPFLLLVGPRQDALMLRDLRLHGPDHFRIIRLHLRGIPRHDFPIARDQELREIPSDLAGKLAVGLATCQKLIQR